MKILRKILVKILFRVIGAQRTRRFFAFHYYKDIIVESERIISIQQDEEKLDDMFWAACLRRFAHIIDKGLQRKDYESGHGIEYYQAACQVLECIKSEKILNDPSVIWSREKIKEYEARQKSSLRYSTVSLQRTCCTNKELLDVIMTRRSIRSYTTQMVDKETIEKIVEGVNWSPTSCNRQTAQVFATNNPKLVKRCMTYCAGATGFSDYVPLFICFCADVRPYFLPKEILLPYVDVSLGIQNCNLIAHSLGISLTVLTWAQHTEQQEREMRSLLEDIPPYCHMIVNAVGGYPVCGAETPSRKSLGLTFYFRNGDKR